MIAPGFIPCNSLKKTDGAGGLFLAVVALVWIVGSRLIWSSPEYRQSHLLLASVLALCFAKPMLWPRLRGMGWGGLCFGAGLLTVHAASFAGGVLHGQTIRESGILALEGLVGVLGLAVFVVVLLDPRWRLYEKWTAFGAIGLLLAGSFIGYFTFIERFINLGQYPDYYSTIRISLIWPTRLLTAPMGQIAWDHTNYAAFYFSLGLILILEFLAGRGNGRSWPQWALCCLLCAGVFLTGSRGGWLMITASLPLLWVRRSPWFSLKTLVLLICGIALGFACLKAKISMIPPAEVSHDEAVATSTSALVTRGSAGRLDAYSATWHELDGSRAFGKGLTAAGKPVLGLTHEHSSYVATYRGGGLVGTAGHLLTLGCAAWAAFSLFRRGRRWPAVLMVAVLSGLLFDRSTVIALTGNYEFITHWVALLIPLILSRNPDPVSPNELASNDRGTISASKLI